MATEKQSDGELRKLSTGQAGQTKAVSEEPSAPSTDEKTTEFSLQDEASREGETISIVGGLDSSNGEAATELRTPDERTEEFSWGTRQGDGGDVTQGTSPSPQNKDTAKRRSGPGQSTVKTHSGTGISSTKGLQGKQVGDYRLEAELGRGGMGIVFKAKHVKLGREAAIKMILGAASQDSSAVERFEREARAVAGLKHPNIVQLFEIGMFEGSPFFALEFVEGGTLSERTSEHALTPKDAAEIVAKLSRAIFAAHENGILHRDLKPANVLMTEDEQPKVSDFGLAKELVEAEDAGATKTGVVMGTPSYMSPEQAQGFVSELTEATDQYSLGAILYSCLSGRPPFVSSSAIDTISQVVHKEPIALRQLSSTVPIDLETICMKALQKDPAKRYPSCEALAEDLERFLRGEPIVARPISNIQRLVRWCKRNPKIAVPSGLAGIFLVATALISTWAWSTTSAQAALIAAQKKEVEEERDEANEQRIVANQQKLLAEDNEKLAKKQAKLALENMQFILTDVDALLRDKPGMSDIRLSVLEAVSEKWDDLDVELTGGVRGEAIPTFMVTRSLMASTFLQLDDVKKSWAEYQKLTELARERVVLKDANDASRSNLARILFMSATVPRRLSDPAKGIAMLKEAGTIAQEILDVPRPEPGSPSAQNTRSLIAAINQNMAVELMREGEIEEASQSFQKALDVTESIVAEIRKLPPSDDEKALAQQTRTLAALESQTQTLRLGLAYVRLRLGDTEQSLPMYQDVISARETAFESNPDSVPAEYALGGALKMYGKSLMWIRKLADADATLREAVKHAESVYQADAEKSVYKRSLVEALLMLGQTQALTGKEDLALNNFERARLLSKEVVDVSADEKNKILLMLSSAHAQDLETAKKLADDFGESEAENSELHLERARVYSWLSQLDQAEAIQETLESAAIQALTRSVNDGFSDPFRLNAEPDLDPIRQQDDFATILKKLE